MEIIRPDGYKRISVEGKHAAEFADQAVNLGTAYGLALQGVGLDRVSANLLPTSMLKRRVWKAKQPWFAAAAGLMLVGATVGWVRYVLAHNAAEAEWQQTRAQVQPVVAEAKQLQDEWQQIEASQDPRQRIENVRRLLDYRDVWPKLMKDLSLAQAQSNPQPELFTTNYEQIGQIPRTERRRIYIDEVQAQYIVAVGATQEGTTPSRSATPAAGADATDDEGVDHEKSLPKFQVTVSGRTTYKDETSLLATFLEWFRDNAKRPDRPYVVDPESVKIASMTPAAQLAPTGTAPGRSTTGLAPIGRSNAYDLEGVGRPSVGRPSVGRPTVGRPTVGRTTRPGQKQDGIDSLLPQRPLQDEETREDWEFTITWTVQTLPPRDTRKSDDAASPDDATPPAAPDTNTPDTPGTPATPGTPGTPAASAGSINDPAKEGSL